MSFWLLVVGGKLCCLPLDVFLKGEQSQSFALFCIHPGGGCVFSIENEISLFHLIFLADEKEQLDFRNEFPLSSGATPIPNFSLQNFVAP